MKLPRYFWAILLVLPIFYFMLSSYFHENVGLYSLRSADPEYIYYICGVSIANGHMEVGNIDHPGTTLQYFLAATFRATHWMRTTNIPFNEDILAHPDLYLKVANNAINFMVVLVMFALGFLAVRIVPNIWYGLIIQFTPFVSDVVFSDMGRITPEIIMPVFLMALSVYVVSLLYEKNSADSHKTLLVFATIIATILALKLTLAFLIIIPLVLIPSWKKKLVFLAATVVFFLIFAIPVTLQLDYFWRWMKGLFLYSGQYGTGESNIVKINEFIPNIVNLVKLNKLYFFFTALFLIAFALTFATRKKSANPLINRISLAVALVVLIQVAILGKQFKTTYFVPALLLLPLMIILASEYLKTWLPEKFAKWSPAILIVLVVSLFVYNQRPAIVQLSQHFEKQSTEKMLTHHYLKAVEKESVKILMVGWYGGPSEEYALMTSYQWAGKDKAFYLPTLAKLYPDTYIWYPWDNTLNFWAKEPDYSQTSRPVYIYIHDDSKKDEYFTQAAKYFPEKYELLRTFFNEATNEAVYKLVTAVSE